uniref:Uncharacterized protein n=1 Tax=Strigamia maritima TaxID=126957 RepID=T1JJM5_STRMM
MQNLYDLNFYTPIAVTHLFYSPDFSTHQVIMGSGGFAKELCFGVFWFLVLIFIGIWISTFCAGWYILFSIFTPCINALKDCTDVLLKGVNFAHTCSDNMVHGRSYNIIKKKNTCRNPTNLECLVSPTILQYKNKKVLYCLFFLPISDDLENKL